MNSNRTRFMQHYVQRGDVKVRANYWIRPDGAVVVVSAKDYGYQLVDAFADDVQVTNDSDMMTDYFAKSRAVIPAGHPLHSAAKDRVMINNVKTRHPAIKTAVGV